MTGIEIFTIGRDHPAHRAIGFVEQRDPDDDQDADELR